MKQAQRSNHYTKPVRLHIILQMEATECGAACLAMVLGHFGRWLPLEYLRHQCNVSRDGVSASTLVKVARSHGLNADGYSPTAAELSELGYPLILFWKLSHFVVLEGIDRKGKAWIADPACGRRALSMAELEDGYSGIALRFAPGTTFQQKGRPPNLLSSLKSRILRSADALTTLALVALLLAVPGLLLPSFSRVFVDDILVRHTEHWFAPLVLGILATGMVAAGLVHLQQRLLLKLDSKLAVVEAVQLFWSALHLSPRFYEQRSPSEVASRVKLADQLATAIGGPLGAALSAWISGIIFLLFMFAQDWLLALVVLTLGLLQFAILSWTLRHIDEDSRRLAHAQAQGDATALSMLGMLPTWRVSGAEQVALQRWRDSLIRACNAKQHAAARQVWLQAIPNTLTGLTTATVLLVGGWRMLDGAITLGMLVAFNALAALFMQPIAQIARSLNTLHAVSGSTARIDDLHNYSNNSPTSDDNDLLTIGPSPLKNTALSVRTANLSFSFAPHATPVLDQVSFSVAAQQWVAVTGPSGSGKSTLARIIAQLDKPSQGDIYLGDTNVRGLAEPLLRSVVGYVEQEPMLFEGSIVDNLTLWNDQYSEADIMAVAKLVGLHDDICTRPGDYESRLSSGGQELSRGQAQRLIIARALLRRPGLLILDEATSALDATSEQQLLSQLRRLPITVLIVTHRSAPLAYCDAALHLEQGRVKAFQQRKRPS